MGGVLFEQWHHTFPQLHVAGVLSHEGESKHEDSNRHHMNPFFVLPISPQIITHKARQGNENRTHIPHIQQKTGLLLEERELASFDLKTECTHIAALSTVLPRCSPPCSFCSVSTDSLWAWRTICIRITLHKPQEITYSHLTRTRWTCTWSTGERERMKCATCPQHEK